EDAGKDPIKRAELIGSIVQSISVIPEAIVRDVYIKECAQLLHVEDRLLVSEVAKRREQQAESKAVQAERERQRAQRQAEQQALDTNGEPLPPPPTEMEATLPDGELPPPVLDDELGGDNQPLPPPPGYLPHASKANEELLKYERLILRMIIRYGEQVLFQDDEQQNVTVIGYIDSELRNDELTFSTPLHQQILNEAIAQQANNGFKAERYFLMHENPTVSQFAGNLISERYQLSKYHSKGQKIIGDEERLGELIPHLVINYKYAIVGEELKKMLQQLQDPSIINDAEKCNDLMNRYSELRQTQNLMAKHLGDRVVIKA
ncbi:MAG: DNA primase, partial [Bacteroides sp.]|nr:DNA primase [Bacteroides sp.]